MFGLAHSLADPKGKEEECDEATKDSPAQKVLRVVGRSDIAGVIWVVDNSDRVSGGAVEGLGASAFDASVDLASSISEPYRDCVTLSLPTIYDVCVDDDSLCSDTVTYEDCVVEPLETKQTHEEEG